MSAKDCVPFKVMLVEDDDGFRRSLAGILKSRFPSMVLEEAADGTEAMEKVKSFLPQLGFMDISCRDRTGWRPQKKSKRFIPTLMLFSSLAMTTLSIARQPVSAEHTAFFQKDRPPPIDSACC